jgi:hypothetical protein
VCLSLWWHKQERGFQFNATLYRREGCKVNTNIKEEGESNCNSQAKGATNVLNEAKAMRFFFFDLRCLSLVALILDICDGGGRGGSVAQLGWRRGEPSISVRRCIAASNTAADVSAEEESMGSRWKSHCPSWTIDQTAFTRRGAG